MNPVTPLQKKVLLYVIECGERGCTSIELADYLGLKAGANHTREARAKLEALQSRGYVEHRGVGNGQGGFLWTALITRDAAETLETNLVGARKMGGITIGQGIRSKSAPIFPPTAYEVATCPPHVFSIPSPDGRAVLPSVCKKCGTVKGFTPWIEMQMTKAPEVVPA